jgi:hypothetical protein
MLLERVQGSKLHAQVGQCLPGGETGTQFEASSLRPSVGD